MHTDGSENLEKGTGVHVRYRPVPLWPDQAVALGRRALWQVGRGVGGATVVCGEANRFLRVPTCDS